MSVALGVALRGTRKLLKSPGYAAPPVIIPLLFFAAFTGALSSVSHTQGFHYYNYTAFQFVFALYEGMILVGVFTSFDVARDFEGGFSSRMMVAAPRRMLIVLGYVIVCVGRAAITAAVLWGVALAAGMPVRGSAIDIVGLVALALMLSVAVALYGAGVALRLQTAAAGVLVLIPSFMVMFCSPVLVERHNLHGWLHTVANINPLTPLLESGRGYMANDPVSVVLAFVAAGGLVLVFALWAAGGMRKAERGAPGGGRRRRGPAARRAARAERRQALAAQ